jgi:hypothetical protein
MPTSKWWKDFYASEREQLDRAYLERLIEDASAVPLGRALIFPHTRLSGSGHQTAAVAKAIVESRCDAVLAIGVLHGMRRAGAPVSTRRIYSAQDDITRDEFSLDNFETLLSIAAEMADVKPPVLHKRYPFLTGEDPRSLHGYEELERLVANGAALVATGDLIHHGFGYGTAPESVRELDSLETVQWATQAIQKHIDAVLQLDFRKFEEQCDQLRSDFRDVGPVLSSLVTGCSAELKDLRLIDYSDVLEAAAPTWVAAALIAWE